MNLTRGWLSEGKPQCLAPAFLYVACILLAVHSCPAITDDSREAQAAEADVLPATNESAASDLSLQGAAAAKAGALAAFSEAILAEDNGDSDTALADYQKALSLDPGYTELAVKVAYELARRGDTSAGIQVLKDSIKASPKAALAYLYLSQLYADPKFLGKPEIGLKYAEQALDLDPTNFTSYVGVYEIYENMNQPAKAAAILARAAKQDSNDPQYWLLLGDFEIKTYDTTPPAAADIKQLTAIYGKALALDGDNPSTLARVADFYSHTDQEAAAIPLYLKAIKLSPANPADGDDSLDAIRNSLAICLDAVGRTPEAIATLEQLIKDNPLRTDSYKALCNLYFKSKNTDAALGVCKQLMLLDPTDPETYIRLGALQLAENQTEAAIQTFTEARQRFPTEPQIIYRLGIALTQAKRSQEALALFDEAEQDAASSEPDMLDGDFYFSYGAAAEQAGLVDKAAELFKKSIALDPASSAEACNYIGFMWVDRGLKLEEAAAYIKRALQMDPQNAAYIDSLGWYYFKKGNFTQALTLLKKAATLIKPEDAIVDEHLGDAYSAENDTTDALNYWQRASGLDKENKEIAVKIAGARQKLARQGTPAPAQP